jgi:uncharacterized protein (TIGR03382 family)
MFPVIASFRPWTNSNGVEDIYAGESFVTPGAGPYSNIVFNFYSHNKITPEAPGIAYLLSEQYLGTPNGLSSSTPGYITSVAGSGNLYTFSTSVELQANTEYRIYDSSLFAAFGWGSNTNEGYQYHAGNGTSNFQASTGGGVFYLPQCDAAPEPATAGLAFAGLSALTMIARRRRGVYQR